MMGTDYRLLLVLVLERLHVGRLPLDEFLLDDLQVGPVVLGQPELRAFLRDNLLAVSSAAAS